MANGPEFDEYTESEALMGPYRSLEKSDDNVDPGHVAHHSNHGGPAVPTRLYGHGNGSAEHTETEGPQE